MEGAYRWCAAGPAFESAQYRPEPALSASHRSALPSGRFRDTKAGTKGPHGQSLAGSWTKISKPQPAATPDNVVLCSRSIADSSKCYLYVNFAD
jgi:hypothetical protein